MGRLEAACTRRHRLSFASVLSQEVNVRWMLPRLLGESWVRTHYVVPATAPEPLGARSLT